MKKTPQANPKSAHTAGKSQKRFKRKPLFPRVNILGLFLALSLFALILIIFTAPKISQLVAQNSRIHTKTAELKHIENNLALTTQELEKMQDAEYLRRLARDRFLFADGKETTYSVLQNNGQTHANNAISAQKQGGDHTAPLKKDLYVVNADPVREYLKREYREAFGIKTAK